ncbi:MAG: LPXTG cell wall anchor domain-containing protein [Lacticaseibacillus casei]
MTFNPADLAGASRAVTFKLDVPVDRTTLAATIKTAGNLKAKDYTKASFATLTQALTEAKAVIADLATDQQTVDDANTALVAAIDGLVKTADTKALQAALTAAAKLDAKTYTDASWRDLQAAIDAAKDVLTLDEPTQVMVDHATKAVLTAQKALVKRSQTDPSSKTPPTKPLPADKNGRHQKTQADMPQTGDKVIQWLSLAGVGMLLLIGGLMIWRKRREQ